MLLRRSSARISNVGDQTKGGSNVRVTSQERKCKGGGKNVASSSSTASVSSTASATSKQSQTKAATTSSSGGNWKGRRSGWEARFLFKDPEAAGEAAEAQEPESEKDTRTTVMIRNIPNKYRYPLLFSAHCCDNVIFHGCHVLRIAILLMLEAFGSQPEAAAQHAGQPLHPGQRANCCERRGWGRPTVLGLRFRLPPHRFQVSSLPNYTSAFIFYGAQLKKTHLNA